ncbi:MAG: choice-of-anchor P family protein, partial [Micromonosporaceae bacterium]
MIPVRIVAAAVLAGGLALPGVAAPGVAAAAPVAPASGPGIGGFQLKAQTSLVAVQLYEQTIPIPAEPQAELNIGYTRSTVATGPDGRGTASWLWPGDSVGDGFGTIIGDPKQTYPVQVNSRTPNGPEEQKQELTPGSGMSTSAGPKSVKAKVNLLGLAAPPPGGGLPGLPGLPGGGSTPSDDPALPAPPGVAALVTAEGITSSTQVTANAGTVVSTAHTAAKNIALLGGLITIDALDTRASATSDAARGTADGLVTITGVRVAGQRLAIDSKGVHVGGQGAEIPGLPKQLTDQLKALGISVEPLPTTRSVAGAAGTLATSGLVISVDTKPLRSKLDTSVLDPIIGALPQELQDQLRLVLGLGPKLVFVVGAAQANAAASAPVALPPLPPGTDPG